jgi:two-component system NtrC family sensor kinase
MVNTKPSEHCLLLNVGVVAEGSKCLSIIRDLSAVKPTRLRLKLVAIATTSKSASCNKYAGDMGIDVFENYTDLLSLEYLDLIIDLSGEKAILMDIIARKPPTVGIMDETSFLVFFDMAQHYEKMGQKETEITLATSFASTLLEASPDGVLVIDRDYRVVNSNNSLLITDGTDRKGVLGKFCYEILNHSLSPCSDMETRCPVRKTLGTGKPARCVHDIALSDGNTQICQVTAYPIFNRFGEIAQLVLTVRDMTQDLVERIGQSTEAIKKDLARVVREDRLASLGRLVASVCHEINNPITAIVTFTKLVLSHLRENEGLKLIPADLERYLELSFREALRCGGIVKNLLTFARHDSVEASKIDILEMLNTILLLTGHQMELASVTCRVDLPAAPFTAWGDYGQIQQCLLNLIFNAIDAMPDGGTLTIKGSEDKDSNTTWLEITDTGHGIESENLQRIFEPFFTTKTGGKGVGLGLAMVYGIIREHQGAIEVDSTPGCGATFRVKLPRT